MVKGKEVKRVSFFRSLAFTLAGTFLTLTLFVLLLSSGLELYNHFLAQQHVIADQQYFIAQDAATKVKDFIQEKFSMMYATASLTGMATSEQKEQKLAMEKLLGLEPSFRQIVLLNVDKQQLLRVSRLSQSAALRSKFGEDVKDDIILQVKQGKNYVSPIYIDEVTSEPLVMMIVPVKDILGDVKGMLLAEVNLKFLWDLVGRINVGKTGVAYVVDRYGNLIAFGDISRVLKHENLIRLEKVKEFVNSGSSSPVYAATVSKGINGDKVIANYVPLGTPDWAVVVELPYDEAYEGTIEGVKRSVLILLLIIILSVIVGFYLSKRITKPLENLTRVIGDLSLGKLDVKIDPKLIKKKDEVGDLARAFDRTIVSFKLMYLKKKKEGDKTNNEKPKAA